MKTEEERLKYNEYQLAWHNNNKEKVSKVQKAYYQKHKEKYKAKARLYYKNNKKKCSEWAKKRGLERRLDVLTYYSEGKLRCNCCGEDQYEFLCIDHIENNGAQHRRETKTSTIYQWLITNNYPKGFQVLCHNCNMAKGFYKQCPHEQMKKC